MCFNGEVLFGGDGYGELSRGSKFGRDSRYGFTNSIANSDVVAGE